MRAKSLFKIDAVSRGDLVTLRREVGPYPHFIAPSPSPSSLPSDCASAVFAVSLTLDPGASALKKRTRFRGRRCERGPSSPGEIFSVPMGGACSAQPPLSRVAAPLRVAPFPPLFCELGRRMGDDLLDCFAPLLWNRGESLSRFPSLPPASSSLKSSQSLISFA